MSDIWFFATDIVLCNCRYSQNIVELNLRRKKLEENNYDARNGRQLKNYELYKQFYQLTANLNITFTQIRGHKPTNKKSPIDMIFSKPSMGHIAVTCLLIRIVGCLGITKRMAV